MNEAFAVPRAEYEDLRDFFDNAPDMFVSVDAKSGAVRSCNETLLRRLSMSREQILGTPILDLYHAKSADAARKALAAFRVSGHAEADELYLRHADGTPVPVSLRASAVRGPNGEVLHSRSIWRDLSLEHEVRELRRQARRAEFARLEGLSILAGGIAHDFNNLLMGILGNAEIALAGLSPSSPLRENVLDMQTASKRAAELTNQMLAYSGRGQFTSQNLDLSEVARETSNLLRTNIPGGISLELSQVTRGATTNGDATQIRQITMNLITNAADSIGERSGAICVKTGQTQVSPEMLKELANGSAAAPGLYAFIEVSDSGSGMGPDTLQRMFDPYFSTKEQGHGLGLAAMLGIVRGHGGAIRVHSTLGAGTTVRVLLPYTKKTTRPPKQTEPAAAPERGGGLILVVDDQDGVRTVITKYLERAGFEVISAQGGFEALELFHKHQRTILAVLLDISMPGIDGHETRRRVKALKSDARVIMMSGYSREEVIASSDSGNAADFIQKPFSPSDLIRIIRRIEPDTPSDEAPVRQLASHARASSSRTCRPRNQGRIRAEQAKAEQEARPFR